MKDLIKDAESKVKRGKNGKKDKTPENKGRFETGVIRSRTIPPAVMSHFSAKIESLESHIEEVLQAEAVAKMDRIAEMEATRAQNIIEHSKEIQSKPKKEWFASGKQKETTKAAAAEKKRMIEEKVGTGMHRMTRKKRRAREALEALNAPDNDEDDEDDPLPPAPKVNIKSTARNAKRQKEAKEQEKYGKSLADLDLEREMQRRRKKKGTVGKDASGDGSLFDEERVSYSRKERNQPSQTEKPQSHYSFRDENPNLDRKLGKKKGVKKFKSKSKYKRR